MRLVQANVRERLNMRLYDRRGRVNKRDVKRFYRFMRCRRTGRRKRIAWRLIRNLYTISRAFKGRTIYVYSGYRHPRVSRLKRSYHGRGQAVDFRVAGVSNRRLRDFVRTRFKRVGVGYYPNSLFVHMDVRNRSAFWVDASGPGEEARYVNAYQVLRAERTKAKARKQAKQAKIVAKTKARKQAKHAKMATKTKRVVGNRKPVGGVAIIPAKKMPESPTKPAASKPSTPGPPPVGPPPEKVTGGQAAGTDGTGPKAAPAR